MKDTQGNYQELLLPNAPYLVPAGQANSQVQWKYIAPAIQNAWSPRPELSTAFDFCFIKCRCADGATRRQADRNRRRLPAVGSEEIIAPFVIGFDHGRDVYFQKITDRPLVFGYELDETPYMQTDLILHKTSSRYMAAHWGNYLDQKDFPANSAADAAARAEMDLVSSARFWNTEQNQAKAARNKAHPSPPQVLFASGQRRNQPRCKVAPLPEYMKQSFVVLNIPMEYDDATQICPHQVYGGNRTANLGGVCLLKPDKPLERFLDFPYYTRHPFFTNEIAQRSLVGDTLIAALLQFCRESCRCPTDPDYETITPKVPGETEAGQGGEPERREDEPGSIGTNILGYSVLRSKTRGGDDFHGQFDGCSVMGLTCTGSRSHVPDGMSKRMSIWEALGGRKKSPKSSTADASPVSEPTDRFDDLAPPEAQPLGRSNAPFQHGPLFTDPSALHPKAGLGASSLDYLTLEDSQLSDLPGAQSALPSRGFTDDLCYGSGVTYLAALSTGGLWGLGEGLQKMPSNAPPKLRLNAVLNSITRRGPFLGNSAGVVAMCYNGFNSTIGYYRGKHDASNSIAAGALSGMLFKSTRGAKPMLISGGIVATVAGAWAVARKAPPREIISYPRSLPKKIIMSSSCAYTGDQLASDEVKQCKEYIDRQLEYRNLTIGVELYSRPEYTLADIAGMMPLIPTEGTREPVTYGHDLHNMAEDYEANETRVTDLKRLINQTTTSILAASEKKMRAALGDHSVRGRRSNAREMEKLIGLYAQHLLPKRKVSPKDYLVKLCWSVNSDGGGIWREMYFAWDTAFWQFNREMRDAVDYQISVGGLQLERTACGPWQVTLLQVSRFPKEASMSAKGNKFVVKDDATYTTMLEKMKEHAQAREKAPVILVRHAKFDDIIAEIMSEKKRFEETYPEDKEVILIDGVPLEPIARETLRKVAQRIEAGKMSVEEAREWLGPCMEIEPQTDDKE
ncbi:MAG: Mitochondrial import inner membrane translocase subunit tim23 [Vezdaea aestivalis]|nr:MAG: Mitochondrial import inner membrane translocase subunit tim23 [Vezdaea aestivalis]